MDKVYSTKTCPTCGKKVTKSKRFCSQKCWYIFKSNQNGLSRTRTYISWRSMLQRCYSEKNPNFPWYGGRGIFVCCRWRKSFLDFHEDLGPVPSKHSLDRINTQGSYTCGKCQECQNKKQPFNCQWATRHQQSRNCKNNLWFTHNGKTLILKDWARLLGIPYLALYLRIKRRHWPFEQAISKPLRKTKKDSRPAPKQ